jgi:hypothetical protein
MGVDVRTRSEADIREVPPDQFFTTDLPQLLETNGEVAARSAAHLELAPLTLWVGANPYFLTGEGTQLSGGPGEADGGTVVQFSAEAFSLWVQEVKSMLALLVTGGAKVVSGDSNAALGWDAVLRSITDGRAVYEPNSVPLVDRSGNPLDVSQSFGPDADDAEMGWFLQQTGFLVLRGWVDANVRAEIDADIDSGLASARRDDPRRWWATLANGDEACVRLKHFDDISETGQKLGASRAYERICALTGDTFAFPASWIESLIKPSGVSEGPSEIAWHKDCWQGKHAYFCSGVTIGVLLTPSDEQTGGLHVMAGSHRTNFPAADRHIDQIDLPTVALYGEPGDLTVHLSCAMHYTSAPKVGSRRLMYAGYALLDEESGTGVDNNYTIKHAQWSRAVSNSWQVYA